MDKHDINVIEIPVYMTTLPKEVYFLQNFLNVHHKQ